MKKPKKLLAVVLSLVCILLFSCPSVFAADYQQIDYTPKPEDLVLTKNIEKMYTSRTYSGALMQNGDLYVWGTIDGVSQTPTTSENLLEGSYVTTPKKILTDVKSAFWSDGLYAAITKDGSLYMWGASNNYTIPDGQPVSNIYETPYKVESIGKVRDFIFYRLPDAAYVAAITISDELYIWGGNIFKFGAYSEPTKILENVKEASMASDVLAAVTKDNKLYLHNKSDQDLFPEDTEINPDEEMSLIRENVASVQTCTSSLSYLDTNGSLWTWGYNGFYYQFGHGDKEMSEKYEPKKILDNVKEYNFHFPSFALTANGNLYSWGDNNSYSSSNISLCGVGSNDRYIYSPTLVMSNVDQLIHSDYSSSIGAIKKDGTLWNWGYSPVGQIGASTTKPVKILDNVKSAVRDKYHVLAQKKDGSLWAWGYNYTGKLANGEENTICGPLGDFTTITRKEPILITLQGPSPSVNDNPSVTPTEPTNPTPVVVPKKVSRISLSGISNKLAAGSKISLSAKITPANAANKKLVWKSNNTKLATVSSKGLVSINKKTGGKSVIITATAADTGKVKASYKISIMTGKVTKVSLSGKSSVKAGQSITLKAAVKASGKANKQVRFTSSNTKYATVSAKGLVKATKAGKGKKVTITATATDGTGKKASKSISIK